LAFLPPKDEPLNLLPSTRFGWTRPGHVVSPDCSNPQAKKILIVALPVTDATGAVQAADLVAKSEAVILSGNFKGALAVTSPAAPRPAVS
jgi:hypothetical protein